MSYLKAGDRVWSLELQAVGRVVIKSLSRPQYFFVSFSSESIISVHESKLVKICKSLK